MARRSLPTPVSPHSSTLASVLAQISTIRLTRSMAGDWPTTAASTPSVENAGGPASAVACRCRSIRARSGKMSSLRKGLVRKSKAPSLTASTATGMLP